MKQILAALVLAATATTSFAAEAYDCYGFGVTEECEYVGGVSRDDTAAYIDDAYGTLADIMGLGYKSATLVDGSTLVIEAAFKGQIYNIDLFAKLFAVRNVFVNTVQYVYQDRIIKEESEKVFGYSKGYARYTKLEIYSAGRLSQTMQLGN